MKWIQPQAFLSYSSTKTQFQNLHAPPAEYQGRKTGCFGSPTWYFRAHFQRKAHYTEAWPKNQVFNVTQNEGFD